MTQPTRSSSHSNNSTYITGVAYAIFTGVCWAVLAIGLKYAVQFVSSGSIAWARMIIAFSLLFLYFLFTQRPRLKVLFTKPSLLLILGSLSLAFNYYAFMKCVELTTASYAQVMIQLGPLTLLIAGVLYFKESMNGFQWLGVLIATIGFLLFNWDRFFSALALDTQHLTGTLWILGAAITWTIFAAVQKIYFSRGWTPQMYNVYVYGFCCVALFPTASVDEILSLNNWQLFIVLLLGLNTLFAYGALGEALMRIPASTVSLIIAINPVLCIALVQLITYLGLTIIAPEPLSWRGYLGAGLVVIGVAIAVTMRTKKR